jgi:LacI family transcriptional regulator
MMDERNVDVQVPTARAPRPVSPPLSGIANAATTAVAGPVPHAPAHRRRGNRKRVLLVLHYYDYRHHSGVARYAAQAGWALEDAYTMIRSLPDSWDGDGIISFHGPSPQFIDWCKRAAERVPVVDIGEYEEYSDLPRVTTDTARIAEMAVEHFAARGYRNVGFTWAFDNPFKAKRLAAARRAAEARGLNFFDVPLDEIPTLGRRSALPIALLATNDAAAVRALRACEDANLLVPEQVAILGVDNFEYRCVPASVPLSSIDADQERLGYEAAALLDRIMAGAPRPQQMMEVPPVGIVQRDSTDMLAVGDVEVAKALRYIIANYRRRVGLRDVARATSISLRRLQTRFKDQLGRTILQEINGRRIAHAQELLRTTGKKIRVVAAECGFGGSVKLIRVFKQYVGTSPKRYRKQLHQVADVAGATSGE